MRRDYLGRHCRQLTLEKLEDKAPLDLVGLEAVLGAAWLQWENELKGAGVTAEELADAWTKGRESVDADPSLDWLDDLFDVWITAPAESESVVLEEPDVSTTDWLMAQMGQLELELDPELEFDPAVAAAQIQMLMDMAVWSAIAAAGDSGGVVTDSSTTTDSGTVTTSDADTLDDTLTSTTSTPMPGQPPVANPDSYTILHDTPISAGYVGGNDGGSEPRTWHQVPNSGPFHGTLDSQSNPGGLGTDGRFTYSPYYHYVGIDTFEYYITSPYGTSSTTTVTIEMTNGAPVANPDIQQPDGTVVPYRVSWNRMFTAPMTLNVLINDSDPDGDGITAVKQTDPTNGTVVVRADGTFDYTPNTGYTGADSFTYVATDGMANSAPATQDETKLT